MRCALLMNMTFSVLLRRRAEEMIASAAYIIYRVGALRIAAAAADFIEARAFADFETPRF